VANVNAICKLDVARWIVDSIEFKLLLYVQKDPGEPIIMGAKSSHPAGSCYLPTS